MARCRSDTRKTETVNPLAMYEDFLLKALVSRTSSSTLRVDPSSSRTLIRKCPVSGRYLSKIVPAAVLSLKACASGSRKIEYTICIYFILCCYFKNLHIDIKICNQDSLSLTLGQAK